jgi:hypothetical protein
MLKWKTLKRISYDNIDDPKDKRLEFEEVKHKLKQIDGIYDIKTEFD